MKKYYYLMVRDGGSWCAEFGDYDRDAVKFERDEYRAQYKARDLRIETFTGPITEQTIRDRVAQLNAEVTA